MKRSTLAIKTVRGAFLHLATFSILFFMIAGTNIQIDYSANRIKDRIDTFYNVLKGVSVVKNLFGGF